MPDKGSVEASPSDDDRDVEIQEGQTAENERQVQDSLLKHKRKAERATSSSPRQTSPLPLCLPSPSGVRFADVSSDASSDTNVWVPNFAPKKYADTFREVLDTSGFGENLYLFHEIALDRNFKVEDLPKNPIKVAVETQMRRAYFDLLREDLTKDPPVYEHALKLLLEVKEYVSEKIIVRTSHGSGVQAKMMALLGSVLDENSLRNQIEQGTFSFKTVVRGVCDVLGQLCAPIRDDEVKRLRTEEDMVALLKGIFELLEHMEQDVTNFMLTANYPDLQRKTREMELQKFLERRQRSGDANVRLWLRLSHDEVVTSQEPSTTSPSPSSSPSSKRVCTGAEDKMNQASSRGYVRLIESMHPVPFPETLLIDKLKLQAFAEKFLQMIVCTSAIWATCNLAGKEISEADEFKRTLKDHLIVITNDIEEGNLAEVLPAVAEQCVKEVQEWSGKMEVELPAERASDIKLQVLAIQNEDNAVRKLVKGRISQFIEKVLSPVTEKTATLPAGLSVIRAELFAFAARFLRLVTHNRAAFAEVYTDIVRSLEEAAES